MNETKYRLPEWLGGHEVRIIDELVGWGFPAVTVEAWAMDQPREPMAVARRWLVEITPPSIDDPVEWPVSRWDSETDRNVWLADDDTGAALEPRAAKLGISLRKEHLTAPKGVFEYVAAEVPLNAEQLRHIARAAWQRANAVEGGAS